MRYSILLKTAVYPSTQPWPHGHFFLRSCLKLRFSYSDCFEIFAVVRLQPTYAETQQILGVTALILELKRFEDGAVGRNFSYAIYNPRETQNLGWKMVLEI